ncbi:MAG: sugar phosphate isomerase/epimerase [Clostridia bacterium]|nr:sugar phosphate isomerase/epimerase [Clostridia bacterium]
MLKRGFSTLCCLELSMEEILDLAVKCSMDSVELRADEAFLASFTDGEAWRTRFNAKGITITDVASSIFIRSSEIPDSSQAYLEMAHSLGAKALRIFAAADATGRLDLNEIAEGIKKLCSIALEKGIQIWLETHSELSSGKMCRELLDKVNCTNLKILWDILHSMEYGETLSETYGYIGNAVSHVHLKDGVPAADKREYTLCALGEGEFPFEEAISLLKREGFDGCLSLEWETPWCPSLRGIYENNELLLKKYNEILDKAGATK